MTAGLRSSDRVRTVKSWPPSSASSRSSEGISATQGPHQVAQKFTSTTRPRKSARLMGRPSSVKPTSGAGEGAAFTVKSAKDPASAGGVSARCGAGARMRVAAPAPARSRAAATAPIRTRLWTRATGATSSPRPMTKQSRSKPAGAAPAKPAGSAANALWGGRYAAGPSAIMAEINASIGFDRRLWREDIEGSKAHAAMLARQEILSPEDAAAIAQGLDRIAAEIEGGAFPFRPELEDIHMNIEARLKELIGEPAGRLHTARSRNDQVATDFRLWLKRAIDRLDAGLADLQAALLDQAERHAATVMPGYTHLQPAQPVTFGHHLMAYVEMIGRDRGRLADARARMDECPLGAAALAGTSFPIDREATAKALGFARPMANSLDAVSDRDF